MSEFNPNSSSKSSETKYVFFHLEEGILYCYLKEMELMDLEVVKQSVTDRLNFIQNESYPCLFDITKIKQTTKDARDYLANEGNQNIVASALLVTSPVLRMMANFYIMVNKPTNPSKLFTDREAALEWLKQYKK